jgi:hypothetical protein
VWERVTTGMVSEAGVLPPQRYPTSDARTVPWESRVKTASLSAVSTANHKN